MIQIKSDFSHSGQSVQFSGLEFYLALDLLYVMLQDEAILVKSNVACLNKLLEISLPS